MHFIHNKINVSIDLPEMTMDEAMIAYYEHYKPKAVKDEEQRKRREKFVFLGIILFIIIAVTYLYNK
jgi:hypothetical protein